MSATMQMSKHIIIETQMAVTGNQSEEPDTGFYIEVSDVYLRIIADNSQVVRTQELLLTQPSL